MYLVAKSTSINLRITPEFRRELQQLADFRGLSLSSLAHSLLTKAMRHEREIEPEAFRISDGLEPARIARLPDLAAEKPKKRRTA